MHLHRYIYRHIHLLFIYISYIFKHNIIIHKLYNIFIYRNIYILYGSIYNYHLNHDRFYEFQILSEQFPYVQNIHANINDLTNKTKLIIYIYIIPIGFGWYIFCIPHWMSKSMVKHCMEHVQETWSFIGSSVGQCHGMIWSMVGHKPNRPGMASIWSSPNKSRNGSLACCKPNSSDLLVAPHRWSSPEWQVALATMAHPGCRSTGHWYWWYHPKQFHPGHWSWCLLPCCGLEPGHWPWVLHLWSFQACGQMGPLPYPLAFGSME